jgi:hypothetical protein
MAMQILFLFRNPGWLLMAVPILTPLVFLFYLILLIMRDLGQLPISANLDLIFFAPTDLTSFLTLMVMYFHFTFLLEKRSLHSGTFTMKEES